MAAKVVVGVDGSEAALSAVRWAACDAARHLSELRLICAEPLESGGSGDRDEWLAAARLAAEGTAPGVEVVAQVRRGEPDAVLVDESSRARRVVLGAAGPGDGRGMPGTTADAVATGARCPVVVVRGRAPDADDAGPVLLGVDGSRAGEAAVPVAFEEASYRRVPLVAVHVWVDVELDPRFAVGSERDWSEVAQEEGEVLAERLAGWQERHPEVRVDRVVERDRPVRSLVSHAERAQLVVVGSRGRGGVPNMLLGSTSRALLHCAPCPVLVAREAGRGR
jgi:nucleotide-binding universal stress UspA family protein